MERFRNLVAWIGAQIIYFLIYVFGRKTDFSKEPWLKGPLEGDYIGDKPYEEVAKAEGLDLIRDSNDGSLIPDFYGPPLLVIVCLYILNRITYFLL